jgi:hypothetical protein
LKQQRSNKARARILETYRNLDKAIQALVVELQETEPGGTLVNPIEIADGSGDVHIVYVAKPLQVTIEQGGKLLVVKSVNFDDHDDPLIAVDQ